MKKNNRDMFFNVWQMKRKMMRALIVSTFLLPSVANAEFYEVEPIVGEWTESVCTSRHFGRVAGGLRPRCETVGGEWLGYTFGRSPECSVEDYFETFFELPAEEQILGFARFGNGLCGQLDLEFSGWETPLPYCWMPAVQYRAGVANWQTGLYEVHGFERPTSGSERGRAGDLSCDIEAVEEYPVLRTRTVSCPPGSRERDLGDGFLCYIECEVGEINIDDLSLIHI